MLGYYYPHIVVAYLFLNIFRAVQDVGAKLLNFFFQKVQDRGIERVNKPKNDFQG